MQKTTENQNLIYAWNDLTFELTRLKTGATHRQTDHTQ